MNELRDKTPKERQALLLELRDKMRKMRFDIALREAKNHREYRKMKKEVARILTLTREDSVSLDGKGEVE